MPYKISGTLSEDARIIILKELDWSIEHNAVISGARTYEVDSLVSGTKSIIARNEFGEVSGYGNVSPIYYVPTGLELWTWGSNLAGQLGQEDIVSRSSPVQVGALIDWHEITNGNSHNVAVKTDGTLWTWGYNGLGNLGLGDSGSGTYRSSPVQVGALTDWEKVAGNGNHTVTVKTDGTLWTWGRGSNSQLGLEDTANRSSPTQVGTLTDWQAVFAGQYASMAIKTDGALWAWGQNIRGTLGIGTSTNMSSPIQVGSLTDWGSVSMGYNHTAAIKTDGTLWTWGDNAYGQLGNGSSGVDMSSPVQVGSGTSWSKTVCGDQYVLAIKTDGTLWSWGYNNNGQLGLGDITDRSSPTQVGGGTDWDDVGAGSEFAVAIKTNGTAWSWGQNNDYGQLGVGDLISRSSPVQIGSDANWQRVGCSEDYTMIFKQ